MVKSYTKTLSVFIAITTILSTFNCIAVFAEDPTGSSGFNVNVKESLSVSLTTPTEWASGNIDTFLRNKINLSVTSNNSAGFTASMTTKTTDTFLTNTAKNTYTLPTLASSTTRSSFPANYWGYSLNDTDAGSDSSTYAALVGVNATPITLLSSSTATSGSKDFYFGAKANVSQAAGTYTGTVVVSVVSGVIDDTTNPITPTNPAKPSSTDNTPAYTPAPTGDTDSGSTTYTYRRTGSGSETTTTEISEGDNTDAYTGYTPPQGETYTSSTNVSNNAGILGALTTVSSIAAVSGIFLFASMKKKEEEDEEEVPPTL